MVPGLRVPCTLCKCMALFFEVKTVFLQVLGSWHRTVQGSRAALWLDAGFFRGIRDYKGFEQETNIGALIIRIGFWCPLYCIIL